MAEQIEPQLGEYIYPAEKVMKKDRTIDSSSRFRKRKKATHTLAYISTRTAFVHSMRSGRPQHISVPNPCLILFFTVCFISGKT